MLAICLLKVNNCLRVHKMQKMKYFRHAFVVLLFLAMLTSVICVAVPAASALSPRFAATDPAIGSNDCANLGNCKLIQDYVNPAIAFMSAIVGVAIAIAIIYGGIQYSSSGGDPQKAQAGKQRIQNAIVALIAFMFITALLNFLIPGGVL